MTVLLGARTPLGSRSHPLAAARRVPRGLVVAAALAVVMVLGGCDGDAPEEVPEPEAEPDEPSPDEDGVDAPEEDAEEADRPAGDVLVAGVQSAPEGLDPHLATARASFHVLENVYDTLVQPDGDGGYEGALARDWEVSDDGATWVFELREGVRWHDGEAFRAADVVHSLERVADEGRSAFRLDGLVEVEAVDELSVRVELDRPTPHLLASLGADKGVAIVPEGAGERLDDEPVGTGPFTVAEHEHDRVRLEAFEEHWAGTPSVEAVELRAIPDGEERMDALERGEIDWTDRVPARHVATYEEDPTVVVAHVAANAYYYFAANQRREPWDELAAREALALAFNRDAVVEAAELGAGTVNQTAIPQGDPFHLEHAPFTEDLDAAEELLVEADADGTEVDLLAHAGDEGSLRAAEALAVQWAEVGLDVSVRAEEHEQWLTDQAEGAFDVLVWAWVDNHDPFDYYYTQHHSSGVNNFQGFADEEVDEALEAAQETLDADARREGYADAARRIVDLASYTYLYNPHRIHGWREGVRGYELRTDGAVRFDRVSVEAP